MAAFSAPEVPQARVSTHPGGLGPSHQGTHLREPSRVEVFRLIKVHVEKVVGHGLTRCQPAFSVSIEAFDGFDPELEEVCELRVCALVCQQVERATCVASTVFGGYAEPEDGQILCAFEESHDRTVPRRKVRR